MKRADYNVAESIKKLFDFFELVYTRNTPDLQDKYSRVVPLAASVAGQKYGLLGLQGRNSFFDVPGQFELTVKPKQLKGTQSLVVTVDGGKHREVKIWNDEYTHQTKKGLAPDENLKGVYSFVFKTSDVDGITTKHPKNNFRILQYRPDGNFVMIEVGVATQVGVHFLVAQEKYVGQLRKDSDSRFYVLGHPSLRPWQSLQKAIAKLTEGIDVPLMTELEEAEIMAPLGPDFEEINLGSNQGVVNFFDPLLHGGKGEILIPLGGYRLVKDHGEQVINITEPTAVRVHFKNCEAVAGAMLRTFFDGEVVAFKCLIKPEPKVGKDGQIFKSGYEFEAKGIRLALNKVEGLAEPKTESATA